MRQIDVLYRRIDDDFLDPLVFRPDSMLGVAGLTGVLRAGNAAIANGVGTGVADDKAIYAYTPAMIRYYLAEEPILPIVETYLLRDPEVREQVLRQSRALRRQADRRVGRLRRRDRAEGQRKGAGRDARANRATIRRPSSRSRSFQLSVHPTMIIDNGTEAGMTMAPRHVDFRPFVLLGAKPRVLAGGLTRVALREGSLIVNSSQGGGSKDTWVLEA